jgi:uncharacterized protein YecE (DUF72 family)
VAASTPRSFRFSVKIPKQLPHEQQLVDAGPVLDRFAQEVSGLGDKLGAVLIQLPPSLPFDEAGAADFFAAFSRRVHAPAVCEPRHHSWFTPDVGAWLIERPIARAAANPAPVPGASDPGGWLGLAYIRLHGSPRMYYRGISRLFITALDDALWAIKEAGSVAG